MSSRPVLSLTPDTPDQMLRLKVFRARHPGVRIGMARSGWWEAVIPEDNGLTATARWSLGELLDRLDVLVAETAS